MVRTLSAIVALVAMLSTGVALAQTKAELETQFKDLLDRARTGDANAEFGVGVRYQTAQGVERNSEEAVRFLQLAVDQPPGLALPYRRRRRAERAEGRGTLPEGL